MVGVVKEIGIEELTYKNNMKEDLIFDSVSIPECLEYYSDTKDIKPLEQASVALQKHLREVIAILRTTNPENTYLINKIKQFI